MATVLITEYLRDRLIRPLIRLELPEASQLRLLQPLTWWTQPKTRISVLDRLLDVRMGRHKARLQLHGQSYHQTPSSAKERKQVRQTRHYIYMTA